ncbi:3-hydroxyacyl-CoA dehydrogenase, NAD binding domain [Gaiella occulta]|uniref:3-hydroxyacyl-CoA dehydrogenase, NAD binding domain n=1 Tax=Gaiella occulta TaxID=1002870 RepID=A0A7M2Z0F2_9ACTN|nr:3-hydroxyacyl-CoA dehydrogenase NAD-binding domain-containing protein [Gaiella occulta]RDI75770.1 3-hydroxyacyl-CoA dehydrogenase, NAD binding domain [Gaiella occulta]
MPDRPTRFLLQRVSTRVGPIAVVTMDNGEDWQKPNVFGRAALESLAELLPGLQTGDWRGLVLTGKPFVFAAGADLAEFPHMTDPDLARAAARAGHGAFAAVRDLPFPTLAAINGAAVGGGLEIALHCRFRTVARSVRHIGFPEVFLGIIPGWGGTQLTPRLVGAAKAVELVVANPLKQNRLIDAGLAVEIGLADALLEDVELLDDSIEWLARAIEEDRRPREPVDLSDAAAVCEKARHAVDDVVHGAAFAPYRALELIAGAAAWTIDEGYAAEEDALAELLPGPQAQAGVYAFDLVERRVKRGAGIPDATPRRIRKVGVVGAGLMATQLATLFLRRLEVPLVITDVDCERVGEAVAAIRADLEKQAAKGRIGEGKARFLGSIVTGAEGTEAYSGCDLVIEAVFEEIAVKQQVFGALEAIVPDECLLVSNTSSLSVTAMGAGLRRPERVVGMHFFNPVAVLPLVELVRTRATDDVTLATAWDVTKKLGKRGVLVADAPAFVVNRLLTRQSSVLMQALEHGNTIEETDEAALRIGIPMPPSALLAMVGPRVANHVLHTLHDAYPDRFPLSPTLESFADGEMEIVRTGDGRRSVDEIHLAILEALADECRHILDEGVVASAGDIDACLILGAGFPFFRGGITKHLDQEGISVRVSGRPLGS